MGSNDYNLMVAIKSGDQIAHYNLYKQYIPLLSKFYRTFRSRNINCCMDVEDYRQEAYDKAYCKAVNYVDLNKITDINTWRFQSIYCLHLQSMNKDLVRDYKGSGEDSDTLECDEEGNNPIALHLVCTEDITFKECSERIAIDTFFECLTDDERKIIISKMKINSDNTIPRLKDIAETLGSNYTWAYRKYASAREKFEACCKDNAY